MSRAERVLAGLREHLSDGFEHFLEDVVQDVQFLEASQYELIQLMEHNGIWKGAVPADPGGTGEIEFGLIPYWIANPPAPIVTYIDGKKMLRELWKALEIVVPCEIDAAHYQTLKERAEGSGLVADDGTLFSEVKYAQMDPDWLWALVNYLWTRYVTAKLPEFKTPAEVLLLDDGGQGQVTIGIIGDWGTGDAMAAEVMAQLMKTNPSPDYLIHLGDVYYAGTAGDRLPLNEETGNFLGYWPCATALPEGRSFTLNSNHEMYSNAEGYFQFALADARFRAQAQASCFALQYAGWTLLGLDSAYYSTDTLYMEGALGGATGAQGRWLTGLGLSAERCIAFTHHTGLDYTGAMPKSPGLWAELSALLGGDPAAWYWGHIHNGIVYNPPDGHPTLPRCVGHGAIPFGAAWGLEKQSPALPYYAKTPLRRKPQVANGYAVLTLHSSGKVCEAFYEVGNDAAVYQHAYG